MEAYFNGMTVHDLRKELKKRKLNQNGRKADLIARILSFDAEQAAQGPVDQAEARNAATTLATETQNAETKGDILMADTPADTPPSLEETTDAASAAIAAPPQAATYPNPSREHPKSTAASLGVTTSANPDITVSIPHEAATSSPPDITVPMQTNTTKPAAPEITVSAQPESVNFDGPQEIPPSAPFIPNGSAEIPTAFFISSKTHLAATMVRDTHLSPIVKTNFKDVDNDSAMATDTVEDLVSRKRRPRSPPPEGEESVAKRARNDETADTATPRADEPAVKIFTPSPVPSAIDLAQDLNREDCRSENRKDGWRHGENQMTNQPNNDGIHEEHHEEHDYGRVERSQHPATSALYIKNFMRPLRDAELREHLCQLATPPGGISDYYCIHEFYLDSIRTHAFVSFDSVSAASRVRNALHGRVWPNERNRRELWVDFIPAETISEWVHRERSSEVKTSRWRVVYENDSEDSDVIAKLVLDDDLMEARNHQQQPLAPPPVPSALTSDFPADHVVPRGYRERRRGRRADHRRNHELADPRVTTTGPAITWQSVSDAVAAQRLQKMRSYYTKNRYRDMGAPEEINRYTFEDSFKFVDRGKENYVGIRPPHREAERRRLLEQAKADRPRRAPSPRRQNDRDRRYDDRYDDRYDGSRRDQKESHLLDQYDGREDHGRHDDSHHSRDDRSRSQQRRDGYRYGRDEPRFGRGASNEGVVRSRLTGLPLEEYPGSRGSHRRPRQSRR